MKAGLVFKEEQLGYAGQEPDLLFFDPFNRVLDRSGRLCLLGVIICSVCMFSSSRSRHNPTP